MKATHTRKRDGIPCTTVLVSHLITHTTIERAIMMLLEDGEEVTIKKVRLKIKDILFGLGDSWYNEQDSYFDFQDEAISISQKLFPGFYALVSPPIH